MLAGLHIISKMLQWTIAFMLAAMFGATPASLGKRQASDIPRSWLSTPTITDYVDGTNLQNFEKAPITASSIQYYPLQVDGPERTWVLQLTSNKSQNLALFSPGVSSSLRILLQHDQKVANVYEHPSFSNPLASKRLQIKDFLIDFEVSAGESYLIVDSRFDAFGNDDESLPNHGFQFFVEMGSRQNFQQRIDLEKASLLYTLGILSCMAIYSLLIYSSRLGRDRESL